MNYKKIYITLIALVLLASCKFHHSYYKDETPISIWTEPFEVIGEHPPKHFYLDLRRISDGKIFNHVYVSKHCNNRCALGKIINIPTVTYRYYDNDSTTADWYETEFDNNYIYKQICNCK